MNKILIIVGSIIFCCQIHSQDIQVITLIKNVNASGGVTTDTYGNVYISDYGSSLANQNEITKVYKWNVQTGVISTFADGFKGASGACFDYENNFYQSNPFGNSISRISKDGSVDHAWMTENLNLPVGLAADQQQNIYVCNCRGNTIGKIKPDRSYSDFASSDLFKCPNGLTIDDQNNLYACNFSDGKILKITPQGDVSVLIELNVLPGGTSPVGNGHLTWKNGFLFVTTIGTGEVYKITMEGEKELVAGKPYSFRNVDGIGNEAGFSKPNGIAASISGDTLYLNVSDPSWTTNPQGLHPAHLKMITGICSFPDVSCPLLERR